jgi:hypothetical protein
MQNYEITTENANILVVYFQKGKICRLYLVDSDKKVERKFDYSRNNDYLCNTNLLDL